MTRKQILTKIRELQKQVIDLTNKRIGHILSSGAIDITAYDDNYRLPKILLTDALSCMALYSFRPLNDEDVKTLENIKHF